MQKHSNDKDSLNDYQCLEDTLAINSNWIEYLRGGQQAFQMISDNLPTLAEWSEYYLDIIKVETLRAKGVADALKSSIHLIESGEFKNSPSGEFFTQQLDPDWQE